jgi:hypothetical protein
MSKFLERCSIIDCLKAEIKPLNSTSLRNLHAQYLNEAVECFQKSLPISCIVVSSALIERTLFWQFIRQNPPQAGDTMTRIKLLNGEGKLKKCSPNLGFLLLKFADWGLLFNSLLDKIEQESVKIIRERKAKECTPEKMKKLDERFKSAFLKATYVETRNLFAHGKELLLPIPLTQLLPANSHASSEYGIDSDEWWNPTLETIAYVHLSKTLRFIKAFTDFLIEEEKMRNK